MSTSSFKDLGKRVREGREAKGLSQAEFAERVECQVAMLDRLENDRPILERQGLLPVLERIAAELKLSVDQLMFADTSLYSIRTNELKMRAFDIMIENDWARSTLVISNVFDQVEEFYSQTLAERSIGAIGFREAGRALTDEIVHDMVVKAKRNL